MFFIDWLGVTFYHLVRVRVTFKLIPFKLIKSRGASIHKKTKEVGDMIV